MRLAELGPGDVERLRSLLGGEIGAALKLKQGAEAEDALAVRGTVPAAGRARRTGALRLALSVNGANADPLAGAVPASERRSASPVLGVAQAAGDCVWDRQAAQRAGQGALPGAERVAQRRFEV